MISQSVSSIRARLISAVDCALNSALLAVDGASIGDAHGICGRTPEQTMKNVGLIADPGMVETEKVIVGIMREKQ